MNIRDIIFGKSQISKLLTCVLTTIIIMYAIVFVTTPLFFSEKYTVENFTFYSNYDTEASKALYNEIFLACKNQPFFNPKKKIKIYFADSKFKYRLITPVSVWNALGVNLTFFNRSRIIEPSIDISKRTVKSFIDKNNERDVVALIVHEYFHSCFTKTISAVNRIKIPAWKEEGLAEFYSANSSYNMDDGIKRILTNTPDKSNSYRYFIYRVCVSYIMNYENKTQEDVLKDKRTQSEILDAVRLLDNEKILKILTE